MANSDRILTRFLRYMQKLHRSESFYYQNDGLQEVAMNERDIEHLKRALLTYLQSLKLNKQGLDRFDKKSKRAIKTMLRNIKTTFDLMTLWDKSPIFKEMWRRACESESELILAGVLEE